MRYYFVKRELWGVPANSVERFSDQKAGPLVVDGSIELYDEKKHGDKPGAPPRQVRKESRP
jgi:hypothetical protein